MQFCGIDEAGLGPQLGPLSLAGCRSNAAPEHLQKLLEDLKFWPKIGFSGERAAVADSKVIYRGGFERLEHLALSLYLCAVREPGLHAIFSEAERGELEQLAWYREFFGVENQKIIKNFEPNSLIQDSQFPAKAEPIIAQAQILRKQLAARGWRIALEGLLLSERQFNLEIARCGNKGRLLQGQVARLILGYANRLCANQDAYCVVDHLGSRKYYRPWLEQILSAWQIETLCETAHRSEYRLTEGEKNLFDNQNKRSSERTFALCFWVNGDGSNILCAMASVWAKYRREVLMRVFNRYWGQKLKTAPQTSGYYRDSQPFIEALKAEYGNLPQDLLRIRQKSSVVRKAQFVSDLMSGQAQL